MADLIFSTSVRSKDDGADERLHAKIVGADSSTPGAAAVNQTIVDSAGNLHVAINDASNSTSFTTFNVITSVASGSETSIISYTVPAATTLYLNRLEISGNNVATYNIYLNSVLIARKRTHFSGGLNVSVEFTCPLNRGYKLNSADVLQIKVIHERPFLGDFEARIQGATET